MNNCGFRCVSRLPMKGGAGWVSEYLKNLGPLPFLTNKKRVVRGKTSTLLFYMRLMTNYFCFCDNLICPWTSIVRGQNNLSIGQK